MAAREREVNWGEIMEGGSPRIYGEMMQILDAGIGRVIDAVRHSGRDTLVIFTSDNGGERYSNIWPFVGRKWDLLEGGLRVPQIVWRPGHVEAGAVTDQVSITMDLTASCLAAAGVMPDPGYPLDGQDLLPVLTGQRPAGERTLYWRMANRAQRAIRRGDWKYLKVKDREFLFDIGWDPRERGDMAKKRPDLLNELRAFMGGLEPADAAGSRQHDPAALEPAGDAVVDRNTGGPSSPGSGAARGHAHLPVEKFGLESRTETRFA